MIFSVDERISSTSIELVDWDLSRVYLKNTADYPWFILVPRQNNIQDIDQLSQSEQQTLMNEINQLSLIVKSLFNPDKLNIGALGNIVSQLHIHVVARFTHDKLWPHGIWQANQQSTPYNLERIQALVKAFHQHTLQTPD